MKQWDMAENGAARAGADGEVLSICHYVKNVIVIYNNFGLGALELSVWKNP